MAIERIIGIDFGTSSSVIRVKRYENGKPIGDVLAVKEVVFSNNSAVVPTLIMKKENDNGITFYGFEAQHKKRGYVNYRNFKVALESVNREKRDLARQLTQEFLSYMAEQYHFQSANGFLGDKEDIARTIVSYPVTWKEETKQFLIAAAAKAGFPNVSGMDEAQAAIHAVTAQSADYLKQYGLMADGVPANILLIDMGAGTTDLVLCRHTPGKTSETEFLSTWPQGGNILFGGREIDALLKNFFWNKMDVADAQEVFKRVGTDKFKSWKEMSVSPALRHNKAVTDFEALDSCVEMMEIDMEEYCLDRASFENCLSDYLRKFPELINGCIRNARMEGSDVDLVIVTGGHSQWYFVKEMLAGNMPQFGTVDLPKVQDDLARIIPIARPQETVALGLVYSPMQHVVVARRPQPAPNPFVGTAGETVTSGSNVPAVRRDAQSRNAQTRKPAVIDADGHSGTSRNRQRKQQSRRKKASGTWNPNPRQKVLLCVLVVLCLILSVALVHVISTKKEEARLREESRNSASQAALQLGAATVPTVQQEPVYETAAPETEGEALPTETNIPETQTANETLPEVIPTESTAAELMTGEYVPETQPQNTEAAEVLPTEEMADEDPEAQSEPVNTLWQNNVLRHDFRISDYPLKKSNYSWEYADHVIFVSNLSGMQNVRLPGAGGPWDVSEAQDGSVMAWYSSKHLDGMYTCDALCDAILYIGAEGGVNASQACAGLFADERRLLAVDFNDSFYTTGAVSMEKMFYNCSSLKALDLTCLDTSGVTDMSNMLYGLNNDCVLNFAPDSFDTSHVTKYDNFMYYGIEIAGIPWTELFE